MPDRDPTVADWLASGETTVDPADAEVWSYTFGEKGPDFVLTIRGEGIGRIHLVALPGGPTWRWAIHCSQRFMVVWKPHVPIGGEVGTKAEAVAALRAAWAIEREWRREFRERTAATHGCWPVDAVRAAWRGYGIADDHASN